MAPTTTKSFPDENLPPNVTREGGTTDNPNPNDQPSTIPKPFPAKLPAHTTHSWSNLPQDLSLITYFDPSKPNPATDFGLKDPVQPVIRSKKGVVGRDVFLLRDGNGVFYEWFVNEGEMFRLDGIPGDVDDVVRLVMRDSGILVGRWGTQVWNLGRT